MSKQFDTMIEGSGGSASFCPDYTRCEICRSAGKCMKYNYQKKPFSGEEYKAPISKPCPITGAHCSDPLCEENICLRECHPKERETWEHHIISKQLRIIDRLTREKECPSKSANKPIFTLSIIIDKQTFIMPDIQLTLGATPKGPGIFTLTDNVTGGVIATTFSGQQIGANSNPSVATFAFADTTNNTVTGTPLAAGTGTIAFATLASYTDSLGNAQTNVAFTQTKNFTVSLGADGVAFDIIFP